MSQKLGSRGRYEFAFELQGTVAEVRSLETKGTGADKRVWRRVIKVAYQGGVAELAIDPKSEQNRHFFDDQSGNFRVGQGQEVRVFGHVHSDPKMGLTFVPDEIEVIDAAAAALRQLSALGLTDKQIGEALASMKKAS